MKLHEIPNESPLKVRFKGDPPGRPTRDATFHRIDGSYSLCTLDGPEPFAERVFHLYNSQEMIKVSDHYEPAKEE